MKRLLAITILLVGCNSPETLKLQDAHELACKSACAPREMSFYHWFIGCQCKEK